MDNNIIYSKKEVLNLLKRQIINSVLPEGAELNTKLLIDKYNLNFNDSLEILLRLEIEGFIFPGDEDQYVVPPMPNKDSISVIKSLRREIEKISLKNIIFRLTDSEIDEFENVLKDMLLAVNGKNNEAFYRLDVKFHSIIVKNYDPYHLYPLWNILITKMFFNYSRLTNLRESCYEHENIFKAIKDKNLELAEQLLNENII